MAGILEGVNQRTQLAGHNRLELLLFRLAGPQRFGINVFKVQEVIQCPPLTKVPNARTAVRGIANMRGKTITIIDLAQAIGKRPLADVSKGYVIVTEYNGSVQGFLVGSVEHIMNINWEDVLAPPKGSGSNSYMTAVTRVGDDLVEIIDVEKVLAEVRQLKTDVDAAIVERGHHDVVAGQHVLVVDDSSVARSQIKQTLEQIGVTCTFAASGREALHLLQRWAGQGGSLTDHVSLVISDIEMPEMDGYTLTKEIRADERLKGLFVVLHTSLSGVFNQSLVEKVGADEFIPKFRPDELAVVVLNRLKQQA